MDYVTIPQLTTLVIVVLVLLIPIFVCVWYFGYTRGLKFIGALDSPADPTPATYDHVEDPIDAIKIEVVGYLDIATGPIMLEPTTTHTMPITLPTPAVDLSEEQINQLWDARVEMDRMHFKIDEAMKRVDAKERMRARYLRLLKAERALIRQLLNGETPKLSAYWRKYQSGQQMIAQELEMLDSLSVSPLGIANAPMLDRFIDHELEALILLPENAGR